MTGSAIKNLSGVVTLAESPSGLWRRASVTMRRFGGLTASWHLLSGALGVALWVVAPSSAFSQPPRSNMWITYAPSGGSGVTAPQSDDTAEVTSAEIRPPIFSLRLRSTTRNGSVEADVLAPAGFDRHRFEAPRNEGPSNDRYSDARLYEAELVQALLHHRPITRLRLDRQGEPYVRRSREVRSHDACARHLLRSAIEAQIAAAKNESQRRSQQQRLKGEDLAKRLSPPIDQASLLLRLAQLSLPSLVDGVAPGPERDASEGEPLSTQHGWRSTQIRTHGRYVRLQLDLLSDRSSPASGVCRSLAYRGIARPRTDTCTIQGVIDRRDGWPITLSLSRMAQSADGTTEMQFRRFDRITAVEGFVPTTNPCAARRLRPAV